MKNLLIILILPITLFLASCGSDSNPSKKSVDQNIQNAIDICRCLTEPGNSEWLNENNITCRDAISHEIGVDNWEKVNFSKNPKLNRKWDELIESCTGNKNVKTGIEDVDKNSQLVREIGTSYGYIWEMINIDAQIYSTLAFDGLIFRQSIYKMNGKIDSGDFTKITDISGKWKAINNKKVEGFIEQTNVAVSWEFNENYSQLTNNKAVVFKRISVN